MANIVMLNEDLFSAKVVMLVVTPLVMILVSSKYFVNIPSSMASSAAEAINIASLRLLFRTVSFRRSSIVCGHMTRPIYTRHIECMGTIYFLLSMLNEEKIISNVRWFIFN